MKRITQAFCLILAVSALLSSCSIEKRKYTGGYYVEWTHSKQEPKSSAPAAVSENSVSKIIPVKPAISAAFDSESAMAKANDSKKLSRIKRTMHQLIAITEDCDVILLKSGEEIKAKVMEVKQNEILYKKCDEQNGQTYSLKKEDVFMIKYPNGTKDVISAQSSNIANTDRAEKEDEGTFGILSIVSIALSIILSAIGAGEAILLLIPAAIVFGIIGLGPRRKLKGLAITGLVLGLLFLVGILIVIISFASL